MIERTTEQVHAFARKAERLAKLIDDLVRQDVIALDPADESLLDRFANEAADISVATINDSQEDPPELDDPEPPLVDLYAALS